MYSVWSMVGFCSGSDCDPASSRCISIFDVQADSGSWPRTPVPFAPSMQGFMPMSVQVQSRPGRLSRLIQRQTRRPPFGAAERVHEEPKRTIRANQGRWCPAVRVRGPGMVHGRTCRGPASPGGTSVFLKLLIRSSGRTSSGQFEATHTPRWVGCDTTACKSAETSLPNSLSLSKLLPAFFAGALPTGKQTR